MIGIVLRVYGVPQPQGNKTAYQRAGKIVLVEGKTSTSRRNFTDWRESVRLAAVGYMTEHELPTIIDPLIINLEFLLLRPQSTPKRVRYHIKKPDLDKLARAVLDALTISGLIKDDSLVVSLHATKRFTLLDESPGALIHVSPIQGLRAS